MRVSVETAVFGTTPEGLRADRHIITNAAGMRAHVLTYGASLHALEVPDASGRLRDVAMGFEDLEGYRNCAGYNGQTVGRFANRIAGAAFPLGSRRYQVTANEKGINCLHGGGEFSQAVWQTLETGGNSVLLHYFSKDGSHGFPGNLHATVRYTLSDEGGLLLEYEASADKDTVISLTNHTYFNLAGQDGGDILSHDLFIRADSYLSTDENNIPLAQPSGVAGTPFDFRKPKPIGRDIADGAQQTAKCGGYDHNFCLNGGPGPAVSAYCPESGIRMEMFTDLPGVQLYTGNFLGGAPGKGGRPLQKYAGFCLETQFYPDSPNRADFPSCVFKAGEPYRSKTSFLFSAG